MELFAHGAAEAMCFGGGLTLAGARMGVPTALPVDVDLPPRATSMACGVSRTNALLKYGGCRDRLRDVATRAAVAEFGDAPLLTLLPPGLPPVRLLSRD